MFNIAVSFAIMFVTILCGYVIGTFFDVGLTYYLPFMLWIIALCIFNLFLDKEHVNIYLKEVKEVKEEKDSIATRAMKAIRTSVPTIFTRTSKPNINQTTKTA